MTGQTTGTVYNSTDGPLPYDRAGRIVPARERLRVPDVSGSPVKAHIDAGRFILVEGRDGDPVAPALMDDGDAPEPEASIDPDAAAASVQGDASEQLAAADEAANEATPEEPAKPAAKTAAKRPGK